MTPCPCQKSLSSSRRPLQVLPGCSKVSPQPSVLHAEQPQLSAFPHQRDVPALWSFLWPLSSEKTCACQRLWEQAEEKLTRRSHAPSVPQKTHSLARHASKMLPSWASWWPGKLGKKKKHTHGVTHSRTSCISPYLLYFAFLLFPLQVSVYPLTRAVYLHPSQQAAVPALHFLPRLPGTFPSSPSLSTLLGSLKHFGSAVWKGCSPSCWSPFQPPSKPHTRLPLPLASSKLPDHCMMLWLFPKHCCPSYTKEQQNGWDELPCCLQHTAEVWDGFNCWDPYVELIGKAILCRHSS